MKAEHTPPHLSSPAEEAEPSAQDGSNLDDQVKPTPLLIILGIVVLLAGLVSGLLMSQAIFFR